MRLSELELIFKLPKIDQQLPQAFAGQMALWTTAYAGSQMQNHQRNNLSPELARLSFHGSNFSVHVSHIQVHLHLRLNVKSNEVQNFLVNFYNKQQTLLQEIIQILPGGCTLRIAGKTHFALKTIYNHPSDLVKILHQSMLTFPSLGTNKEFRLQCGYEEKNLNFKFSFQDYHMRQLPQMPKPGQVLSAQYLAQFPIVENGLEVFVEVMPLQTGRSLAGEIVNSLRLFALNLDALPQHFFNNLIADLKDPGITFN